MTTTAPTYYFDLSGFLHRLSNEGFSIGVDTHILIQKIIGDLPLGYEPQVLQTLLMPILCKSPKQQVIYQAVFRQFLKRDDDDKKNSSQLAFEVSVFSEISKQKWYKIDGIKIDELIANILIFLLPLSLSIMSLFEKRDSSHVIFNIMVLIIISSLFFIYSWLIVDGRKSTIAKNEHGITPDDVHKIYADLVPVTFSDTLTQAIARLRLREPLGVQRLDVANTVKASIQNLGFFTPKYQDYTKYTEYLILIQADNSDDHKARLYNTFYEELVYRNISVVRYYFRTSPRYCYNEETKEATLETVLHDNAHCVLLVFAELNTFISLQSNQPFKWAEQLQDLPQRYLMLPFSSAMEAVLAQPLAGIFDAVLPATEVGFEQLENYINQGDKKDSFTRFIRLRQAVPTFPIRIETEEELLQLPELLPENSRKYLLKWIVACAVYPDFSWKMTLFLGQLLSDDDFIYNTWDNLRQLARISWFKETYLPQSIRRIILEKTDKQSLTWLNLEDIAYIKKGILQVYAANKQQGFTGEAERLLTELYKAPKTEAEKAEVKQKIENSVDYVTATLVDSKLKDILFFELPNDALAAENVVTEKTATIENETTPTKSTEKEAFDKAIVENTIAAFEAFLQQFPNGEFAALAKQYLNELLEKQTVSYLIEDIEKLNKALIEIELNLKNLTAEGTNYLDIESITEDKRQYDAQMNNLRHQQKEILKNIEILQNIGQAENEGLINAYNEKLEKIEQLLSIKFPQSIIPETVFIKGGTFLMGSPESEASRSGNELQHEVRLDDFYMTKHQITQRQWKNIMGNNPSYFKENEDCPVEQVSWDDVQEFIKRLNKKTRGEYRLPTEAEWEYACRAGTTTPFNTGENLTTEQANYDGNYPYRNFPKGKYITKTTTVGSYAPNDFGLYDMHGNVYDWCQDWYDENYYQECKKEGIVTNPTGPLGGLRCVVRGGSWRHDAGYCRSAFRSDNSPVYRNSLIGFRLVFRPAAQK